MVLGMEGDSGHTFSLSMQPTPSLLHIKLIGTSLSKPQTDERLVTIRHSVKLSISRWLVLCTCTCTLHKCVKILNQRLTKNRYYTRDMTQYMYFITCNRN